MLRDPAKVPEMTMAQLAAAAVVSEPTVARFAEAAGFEGFSALKLALAKEAAPAASEVKLDWKAQNEEQARKRKLQNELKKTEEEISSLEARDGELDEQLTLEEVYVDHQKVREINDEKASIAGRLEELYARWEELAEET